MSCKYSSVIIKTSSKPDKKLMAIFDNGKKTIHFGAAGMDDFTKTKDKQQKERYLTRHKKNENWMICNTAGSLSRWILWNKESKQASISDYKKRFKLK